MSAFDFGRGTATRSTSPDPATGGPTKCPACGSPTISTTAKSPDAYSYWRCDGCGEVWNMARREHGNGNGRRNSWR